ncbi:hypothetical protein V5799_014326 [Amblyomma americanum]|uniref:Uncharacterized protein n=1 Tax=Amblyomma americanum TaxID=6943 RepID=A0AAQ4E3C9_AMBAM
MDAARSWTPTLSTLLLPVNATRSTGRGHGDQLLPDCRRRCEGSRIYREVTCGEISNCEPLFVTPPASGSLGRRDGSSQLQRRTRLPRKNDACFVAYQEGIRAKYEGGRNFLCEPALGEVNVR